MRKTLIGWTYRKWDIKEVLRTTEMFDKSPTRPKREEIEIGLIFIKKRDAISYWNCDGSEVKKVYITIKENEIPTPKTKRAI